MKRQINWKVVIFSLIAIGFVALSFTINPYFIAGAVLFMLINQWELNKKRRKS